jgi:hypothetical protein
MLVVEHCLTLVITLFVVDGTLIFHLFLALRDPTPPLEFPTSDNEEDGNHPQDEFPTSDNEEHGDYLRNVDDPFLTPEGIPDEDIPDEDNEEEQDESPNAGDKRPHSPDGLTAVRF